MIMCQHGRVQINSKSNVKWPSNQPQIAYSELPYCLLETGPGGLSTEKQKSHYYCCLHNSVNTEIFIFWHDMTYHLTIPFCSNCCRLQTLSYLNFALWKITPKTWADKFMVVRVTNKWGITIKIAPLAFYSSFKNHWKPSQYCDFLCNRGLCQKVPSSKRHL